MARYTFYRQDAGYSSDLYDDTIAPSEANFETNPLDLETDLNNLRSMLSHLLDVQAGDWFDVISTPATLESGAQRGVSNLNDALHLVEKKRVLRQVLNVVDVTVGGGNNFVILGTGELPAQTTAAVGTVTTLGTVVAAHGGTFGTHALSEVAGTSSLQPKNLVEIVDGSTRDPIQSSGRVVYGLLQGESGLTDGATITDTTTTRVQISFVRVNATGDDLEACPVADIENAVINYASTERVRFEDLNEADFLRGAIVDVPGGTTVTRQVAYDNQGTTPVDLTTNATLDLEGPGLVWAIRDDLEANLFRVVEGSAGGTSLVGIAADVDTFDVDAVVNDFLNGASFDTAGTPIQVGITAGEIERAADLILRASGAGELYFDDANRSGSGWSLTNGMKFADTSTEWDNFESAFGEVSLLNAIYQAANTNPVIQKTSASVTADVSADVDVGGSGGGANLDAQIHDLSNGSFVADHDVYLNGRIMRGGADATANFDYYPGTSLALGQLRFEFDLKGGTKKDVLTVISRA